MSGHKIPFEMYQSPLSQMSYTATTGTITIDRMGCVIPVNTTAGAAALTLAAPTKAGIIGSVALVVDGGDLTLTVTNGYNADADTSITFADAGDFVTFISFDIGGTLYWRVLAQEGTNAAVEDLTADQATITTATIQTTSLPTVLAAEHGAGAIGTAFAPRTYRYTREGTIITEIQIDLTGLDSSGVANDVIGLATGGAAYIGRNVVATNGIIYKIEMTCLEVPLTGDADVILVQGSAADEAFDDTVANTATLCDGTGDWALGETITYTSGVTANYYYYLTQGASDDATYTAGQFLIRTYGHAALA